MMDITKGLTPSQAARVLGVSSARVRQLIQEGSLPATKTALGNLIAPEDLERCLEARREAHRVSQSSRVEYRRF